MPVHPLLLPADVEPGEWAVELAIDKTGHSIPTFPKSDRFILVAVARLDNAPQGQGETRAVLVTTEKEMDLFLSTHILCKHPKPVLWFTMAKHHVTEDMIECTLGFKVP